MIGSCMRPVPKSSQRCVARTAARRSMQEPRRQRQAATAKRCFATCVSSSFEQVRATHKELQTSQRCLFLVSKSMPQVTPHCSPWQQREITHESRVRLVVDTIFLFTAQAFTACKKGLSNLSPIVSGSSCSDFGALLRLSPSQPRSRVHCHSAALRRSSQKQNHAAGAAEFPSPRESGDRVPGDGCGRAGPDTDASTFIYTSNYTLNMSYAVYFMLYPLKCLHDNKKALFSKRAFSLSNRNGRC